jgi:hypothetical protein
VTHGLVIGRIRAEHNPPITLQRVAEITPEPDAAERKAILAALAAEEAQERPASPWAEALLPSRGGDEDEP